VPARSWPRRAVIYSVSVHSRTCAQSFLPSPRQTPVAPSSVTSAIHLTAGAPLSQTSRYTQRVAHSLFRVFCCCGVISTATSSFVRLFDLLFAGENKSLLHIQSGDSVVKQLPQATRQWRLLDLDSSTNCFLIARRRFQIRLWRSTTFTKTCAHLVEFPLQTPASIHPHISSLR
jgi:hypothetical protein